MIRTFAIGLFFMPAALAAQTAAPTQATVLPTEKPKLVCRSSVETGSLVKRKKECRTADDWKAVNRARADEARAQLERQGGSRSGQ